jgi:hypothetical protein
MFGLFYFCKRAACFDHADQKKQHQQPKPYGFYRIVNVNDDIPNRPVPEGFGALGDKRPNLGQFFVVRVLSRGFVHF